VTLRAQGKHEAAFEAYTEADRLRPDDAETLCSLGHELMSQGRFQEAVPYFQRGHEAGSRRADWTQPSARWIEDAERWVELEGRLDLVLTGQALPRDAAERVELAALLYAKSRRVESARMYAEAFAEDAALAEDLVKNHRYNAVCAATLAASDGEADAAEWRGRALEWLRADLAAREKAPSELVVALEHWKQDSDLASVRESLDELPNSESDAWRGLWAAVDQALAIARLAAK
jgi:tetratricopeptide (TPR) repeat protein